MRERKAWLMTEIYIQMTEDWGIVLFCLASHTGLEGKAVFPVAIRYADKSVALI